MTFHFGAAQCQCAGPSLFAEKTSRGSFPVHIHKEQQRRSAQVKVATAELGESTGLRHSLSGHQKSPFSSREVLNAVGSCLEA